MFNRILVGIDGSKNSIVASEYGIYLSKILNRPLVGIHIVDIRLIEGAFFEDIVGALGFTQYSDLTEKVKEALDQKGKVLLETFAKECRKKGADCSIAQVFGIPSKELIELSDPEDLLILGKHGKHKNLSQLLFGTTADYIAKHSKCPVLFVESEFKPISKIAIFSKNDEILDFGLNFAKILNVEHINLDIPLECKESLESYILENKIDILVTDRENYKINIKVNLLLK